MLSHVSRLSRTMGDARLRFEAILWTGTVRSAIGRARPRVVQLVLQLANNRGRAETQRKQKKHRPGGNIELFSALYAFLHFGLSVFPLSSPATVVPFQ